MTHFSTRKYVYPFPEVRDAKYVLVQKSAANLYGLSRENDDFNKMGESEYYIILQRKLEEQAPELQVDGQNGR